MAGAERSAAPCVLSSRRSLALSIAAATAAATVLAGGLVTGCGDAGPDHPAAASSSASLTRPPAPESQADAVRALRSEGPLQVVRGARAVVVASVRSGIDAHDLARRVDAAVPAASKLWATTWSQPVVVLVPASLAHWQQLTGLQPDPEVAAVSLGASSVETSQSGGGASAATSTSPGGNVSAGASTASTGGGQRIVVDPVAYPRLSDAGRSVVLRHEVEHLVSAAHTPPGMPSWLVEGTADVVGFTGSGIPVPQAAQELAARVRRSGPPASLPADADFSGGSSSVAYEEGWLACRLIERAKGAAALRGFYDRVGAGIRAHRGSLVEGQRSAIVGDALRQATGWSLNDFVARWQADLQRELGSAA